MLDRHLLESLDRRNAGFSTSPIFPLPALNGQPPLVLLFDHADTSIELAYERQPQLDGPRVRLTSRASSLYCGPTQSPVFEVSAGKVLYARAEADGHAILIEHRNGWLTHYGRLERMFVRPIDMRSRRETKINAGDILGYLGSSRYGPCRPLRFELWHRRGDGYDTIDPIRFMHRWHLVPWKDAKAKSIETPMVAA
jgi:hypothetical protein